MPNLLKTSQHSTFTTSITSALKLPVITREKSDTLLLVFACLSVVLMHFSYQSWWVSGSAISLMMWRSWLTFTGHRLPAKWLLLPIAAALMGLIFFQFRTFLGREAGVAMLIILLSLKMLEMHAKRDLYVVIYLGLFLLTTSFFNSQSLTNAFLVLLILVLLLTAQLSFQFTKKSISLWPRFKLILKMMALAIPLTIFSFVFFPRIQGPFWNMPKDANSARSGLSDTMSPGNISNLAMSEELVFRAKIEGKSIEKSSLYWRAIVLSQFDGKTWTHSKQHFGVSIIDQQQIKNQVQQHIILEPSESYFLFALDTIVQAPQVEGVETYLNSLGELRLAQVMNKRLRYDAVSAPYFQLPSNQQELQANLQLPFKYNPKTILFAKNIQANHQGQKAQIEAVLQHFRNDNFYYTLEPPLLGRNSVDDFLFTTRQGFCEHYASAFVVLMRAMNIPARVVTGYQGGNLNNVDGFLEIRQSDAHAWAEVWWDNIGWVRIDPTAAVSPDRILRGLNFTQKQQGFTGLIQSALSENNLLNDIRMRWSAMNNSWNQWVLNYSQLKQKSLLESLGLDKLDWSQLMGVLFLSGSILIAIMALPLLRHRTRISPVDQVYSSFISKLSKMSLNTKSHEGPQAVLARMQTHFVQPQQESIMQFMKYYIAYKYGKNPPNETEVVQELKTILKRI